MPRRGTNNTTTNNMGRSLSMNHHVSQTSYLKWVFTIISVATIVLYIRMDKQMKSLTQSMEGGMEKTFDEPSNSRRSLSTVSIQNESEQKHDNNHTRHHQHHNHHHVHHNNATTTPSTKDDNKKDDDGPTPYAYMFLIGGIDPSKPGYRGFLYNVMVAAHLLRRHGSTSDIWLYLQMSPNTPATTLPDDEAASVNKLGINVHYMEKPHTASFTDINMEKFRLLQMTQYRRVLFLDADILPLVNMDYLMELSDGDHPLLQPNFVVATLGEPANGGCFMLEPKVGAYEQLLQVVENQRESAKDLGYPFFDRRNGWGHSFRDHGDEWHGTKQSGSMWRWHGAHVDQGLLYYWTKYHQQAVTIFRGHIVENWVANTDPQNDQPFMQASMHPSMIDQYAPKDRVAYIWNCDKGKQDTYLCNTPYYNYAHFTGAKKPWQQGYDENKMKQTYNNMLHGPYRAFFRTLFELSDSMGWGITPTNVDDRFKAESPFGYMPNYAEFARRQQGNYTAREATKAAEEKKANKEEEPSKVATEQVKTKETKEGEAVVKAETK